MARVAGIISLPERNYFNLLRPCCSSELNIVLPRDRRYLLNLDQSTSCTGLFLCDEQFSLKILLDVIRDTADKDTFYRDLYRLIRKLINGLDIKRITMERPVPSKKAMYSRATLLELKGRVSSWIETIDELQDAEVADILPQSWRAMVLNKSKGANRHKKKAWIADDICDLFPDLRPYYDNCKSKDYDGFEAAGIALGYQMYAYTPDGLPLICGTKEMRHTSFVIYKYVDNCLLQSEEDYKMCLGDLRKVYCPEFRVFNERYNLAENIRIASSNLPCTVTRVPDKYFDTLMWKFDGLQKKENHSIIAFIINTAKFPQNYFTTLEECDDLWTERVTSI